MQKVTEGALDNGVMSKYKCAAAEGCELITAWLLHISLNRKGGLVGWPNERPPYFFYDKGNFHG